MARRNHRPSRRSVLRGMAGLSGAMMLPRPSAALADTSSLTLTNTWGTQFKVLEIFCWGGLSTAETLWTASSPLSGIYGTPDYSSIDGLTSVTESDTRHVGTDDNGADVHMGPMCQRLWDHGLTDPNHLVDRMRLVSLSHGLTPHDAARPLALTGLPLGRPKQAGTGAPIEAAFGSAASPASVILHNSSGTAVALEASVTGLLGRENRPLVLAVGNGSSANSLITDLQGFDRASGASDELSAYFESKYSSGRDFGAEYARALAHDSYQGSLSRLMQSEAIGAFLSGTSLYCENGGASDRTYADNFTRTEMDVAAYVLSQGCRYAAVMDGGVHYGYDLHHNNGPTLDEHATAQAGNVYSVLDKLVSLIEAGTLDLDTTLVILHTEFGRSTKETETVNADQTRTGTEHNPAGYAALMLGGPIGHSNTSLSGRGVSGIVGGFDGDDSTSGLEPADFKAAVLYAAGINPFYSDIYSTDDTTVDDVSDLATTFFGAGS